MTPFEQGLLLGALVCLSIVGGMHWLLRLIIDDLEEDR